MNIAPSTGSTPSPNSMTSGNSGSTVTNTANPNNLTANGNNSTTATATVNGTVSRERIAQWINELLSSSTREAALMELSRKREKVADLALLLWHSFGSVAALLYEVM